MTDPREDVLYVVSLLCDVLGITKDELFPPPPPPNGSRPTKKLPHDPMVCTAAEFARATGISPSTVYQLIRSGNLRSVSPPGLRNKLIPISELDKFK